jgi:5'-3' exoribonuclease 1
MALSDLSLPMSHYSSVLTSTQREIFNQVKAFVLNHWRSPSPTHTCASRLTMANTFSARERKFITSLAEDLHLSVTWDEFDDNDQNLVTWRLPGAVDDNPHNLDEEDEGDDKGEWEDVDDDFEESTAAVARVLKKYEKAPVMNDEQDGGFDARHDRSIQAKMDEWKDGYYKVCSILVNVAEEVQAHQTHRANLTFRSTTRSKWAISYTDTLKAYSG